MSYAELQVTTHFSFLRGASSPEELFRQAALLGLPALGIVDRNSVGGVVRALVAAEQFTAIGAKIRMIAGCRLDLVDGTSLLVWPEDSAGWSRLTGLLTLGKSRADPQHGEKGKCFVHWEDLAEAAEGLVGALVPGLADSGDPLALRWMADVFGTRGHVCLTQHRRPGDAMRIHQLDAAAKRFGLTPLATGDVLYDTPDRRMLQDVVTAIREKCTIDELGFRRERHADRHLKSPEDMARRFRDYPGALRASLAIAERCTFSLRDLRHQYPEEEVLNGKTAQQALHKLAWNGLRQKFGPHPAKPYCDLLTHELGLVEQMGYAPYFLTVNSIVQFALSQQILCQGRGSAANSVICFALGITSIDPIEHQLLFERFISTERKEPPDIDVDFEHERREEVIQWIYENYGHDHAALTAVVSRFRSRGALREVGKALGLPEDLTAALSSQVWGWSNEVDDKHADALNLDRSDPRIALTLGLARQLIGTPRHLSQHPGGFVLTRDKLHHLIPVEPAAMVDRRVVEWEKLDIEELGFMKVDILGLGMLGCMRRAFDLLAEHKQTHLTLASPLMQEDDPRTFEMIRQADTLGVFQIESRAQMSMLPRMKPVNFYDIAIQVAIVRPGPIQGNMVHPYLKRRQNPDLVDYPSPALKEVLLKTLGVPLFQEQAMLVAIKGAGFTPGEADRLRRAMATFKSTGGIGEFGPKLLAGMRANGISDDFAERLVAQIEGFSNYGFPESHAASFAKIAYASSWMKCHHPDVFCAAVLNAQPMGFYAPAQLIRDARAHGVEARPVCINDSGWDTRMVPEGAHARPRHAAFCGTDADWTTIQPIRLGMRIVQGLAEADANEILSARARGPFVSIEDVWRRSGVKPAALERLARADAFQALGLNRRQALWAIKGLGQKPLDLFAAADAREGATVPESVEAPVALLPLSEGREVVEDYRATQLSLRAHPVTFLREQLAARRIARCGDLMAMKDGARVEVAGLILVRQRPGSAKGVVFVTLEDETGIANAVLWADRFEANRRTVMSATMLAIRGKVQREGIVIHVVAEAITDLTPLLREIGELDLPRMTAPGDGATHGGTIDPRDRLKIPRQRALESWPPRRSLKTPDLIPVRSRDFH
ncbi:error-prone DNA polymerase [Sphingomonas naasensis]|uniref:Error-prone DNA polymerase n=1 Tax=Sphingomonas naasensis TaxID=1344951 RepID=A0A4S1WIN9_9SPHN|nr:error-prone DNA polymerase [Sphingomonas naasensis]NIJ21496.1 error-prone DNA polymerase [Sphingomonas naasensis]TGX41550.1 DNA polymerase III subunit alpha [Sphingomonas naasensis]